MQRKVFGVNQPEPFVDIVGEIMVGIAENLLVAPRHVEFVLGDIPVPDSVAGAFDSKTEPLRVFRLEEFFEDRLLQCLVIFRR